MGKIKKVAVIGGGAAGFFAAISAKEHHPTAQVTLYEKTTKVLSKVKVSGGGRCNVTHDCQDIPELIMAYPRGGKSLTSIFHAFQPADTIRWFEERGVSLKVEKDGRMFPISDSSQSIIDCLQKEFTAKEIELKQSSAVKQLLKDENRWSLRLNDDQTESFDCVIVTTGGSPKQTGFDWLADLGLDIIPPVPSLFTFNMPNEKIKTLMGVAATTAQVKIEGTKIKTQGPVLITHWGMSGPAILKASSFGARELAGKEYHFNVRINWLEEFNAERIFSLFAEASQASPQKQIAKFNPTALPNRLWHFLLEKNTIPLERRWNEVGKKKLRHLAETITNDRYTVEGKTTFKEEFVTCGGIALNEINLKTMESKQHKGLYFAGEVIDVDAITGGYNFQAAWSGGYVAGKLQ